MATVGIRELKARLSAYVRRARAGEVVYVTDHGEVVAELRAVQGSERARQWEEAVQAGWLSPAERPGDTSWTRGESAGLPPGTARSLLDAERQEG